MPAERTWELQHSNGQKKLRAQLGGLRTQFEEYFFSFPRPFYFDAHFLFLGKNNHFCNRLLIFMLENVNMNKKLSHCRPS